MGLQIATTAITAAMKKIRKEGLPTCVLRAGNISFDKLNMLWNIRETSKLPPVLLNNQVSSIESRMAVKICGKMPYA